MDTLILLCQTSYCLGKPVYFSPRNLVVSSVKLDQTGYLTQQHNLIKGCLYLDYFLILYTFVICTLCALG